MALQSLLTPSRDPAAGCSVLTREADLPTDTFLIFRANGSARRTGLIMDLWFFGSGASLKKRYISGQTKKP